MLVVEIGPNLMNVMQGAGSLILLALAIWAFFKD